MEDYIRKELADVPYVCTTADIWSSFRRSFLGVTVHWVDPQTFTRKSAAIACKRFKGTHNYLSIAQHLTEIHEKYGLSMDKIMCTVTDNGSNFKKALKEFHVDIEASEDEDDNEDEYTEDEKTVQFADINEFSNPHEDEQYYLPKRFSCASHTLSLLGTTDVNKIIKSNRVYRKIHSSVFKKCSALWNKTNRSANKASEAYKKIVGKAPKTPCVTRWNSTYDSVRELLSVKDKLPKICEALEVPLLTKDDVEFLDEYQMCLGPVAFCLDKLQGENNMYIGDVLPWLLGLKYNLARVGLVGNLLDIHVILSQWSKIHVDFILQDSNDKDSLKYCKPLKDGLEKSFNDRFAHLTKLQDGARDHIIASVCHPKWKLRWLCQNSNDTVNSVKEIVLCALKELVVKEDNITPTAKEVKTKRMDEEENNFFNFMKPDEISVLSESEAHSIELELLQYLGDSTTSLHILHKYRRLRSLFLKYNAGIPSSAPVECLFSFAGLILLPRRSTLKDRMFEMCTLMRANKHIK